MQLTSEELRRYSRNIILPEVGEEGQKILKNSKVLIIGAGGLGSPALLYLAASGIGLIGIVDNDKVELSNLQRQIIHESGDIGRLKVESAKDSLQDLNPSIKIKTHAVRLDEKNAEEIIYAYDLILDGSDNIATRFIMSDACHKLKKTLISAAIVGFQGQISTFKSYLPGDNPCYRCLYPEPPPLDSMPSCAENGILSPLAGIMGSMQAAEAIKEALKIGASLSGKLLIIDSLKAEFRKVVLKRDPACLLCSK